MKPYTIALIIFLSAAVVGSLSTYAIFGGHKEPWGLNTHCSSTGITYIVTINTIVPLYQRNGLPFPCEVEK